MELLLHRVMVHSHRVSPIQATLISSNHDHKVKATRLKDNIHRRASILRRVTILLRENTLLPVNTLLDTTHRNPVMTPLTLKRSKNNGRPTDALCKINGSSLLGILVSKLANHGSSPLCSNEVFRIPNSAAILVPATSHPNSNNNHKDNKPRILGNILA
jgi:hypothetical protein